MRLGLATLGLLGVIGCSGLSGCTGMIDGGGGDGPKADDLGGGGEPGGGGGDDGGGDAPPVAAIDDFVAVPASGPYGRHDFSLFAKAQWKNSGLYLRAGEVATVSATGTWSYAAIESSAAGQPGTATTACNAGALVARLGLGYDEPLVHCVGEQGTITAERDGIVYLAMFQAGGDLGEFYGGRIPAAGVIEVTVESDGSTVPTVLADELASYDLAAITSGWVELRGEHVVVTMATADVIPDLATAGPSLDTLDEVYLTHHELRGLAPFDGQRIRFYPDGNVEAFAYMLAGNPVRAARGIMSASTERIYRILHAADADSDLWGYAHELGHDFTVADGEWVYMAINLESWPNLFTLYTLGAMGRPQADNDYCAKQAAYLAAGAYDEVRDDPFLQLCFLMEFQKAGGWSVWQSFFADLNANDYGNAAYPFDGDFQTWAFVRDRVSAATGSDATSRFVQWRLPLE